MAKNIFSAPSSRSAHILKTAISAIFPQRCRRPAMSIPPSLLVGWSRDPRHTLLWVGTPQPKVSLPHVIWQKLGPAARQPPPRLSPPRNGSRPIRRGSVIGWVRRSVGGQRVRMVGAAGAHVGAIRTGLQVRGVQMVSGAKQLCAALRVCQKIQGPFICAILFEAVTEG